jgi:hypothetical protein
MVDDVLIVRCGRERKRVSKRSLMDSDRTGEELSAKEDALGVRQRLQNESVVLREVEERPAQPIGTMVPQARVSYLLLPCEGPPVSLPFSGPR